MSTINTFTRQPNRYSVLRGDLYIDPIDAADDVSYLGMIHMGNAWANIQISGEKQEHFSAAYGIAELDDSFQKSIKRTGSITTDNCSLENLAMFVNGAVADVTQAAISIAEEETIVVVPGRYYQLGMSPSATIGLRNLTDVTVTPAIGGTAYGETDYRIDLASGILQILPGGTIAPGSIKVSYKATATTWKRISSGSSFERFVGLRIIGNAARGPSRDYFFPRCALTPNGDLNLIQEGTSSDYTQFTFDLDILKPANMEAVYIDGRPGEL